MRFRRIINRIQKGRGGSHFSCFTWPKSSQTKQARPGAKILYSKTNRNKTILGLENLRKYGNAPFNVALVHGGPGAGGEMAPIARELEAIYGVLETIQTAVSLEEQVEELKTVVEKNELYGTY